MTETVLVVDDEERIAEMYRLYLLDDYEVDIAGSGDEALDAIDDGIDVLLVDRRMPGLSGDELVSRARERGFDSPIAMVSAVDPDLKAIDPEIDAYLAKPVDQEELSQTVSDLVEVATREEPLREQYALLQQLSVLKGGINSQYRSNDQYQDLLSRIQQVREASSVPVESITESTFDVALRELPDGPTN